MRFQPRQSPAGVPVRLGHDAHHVGHRGKHATPRHIDYTPGTVNPPAFRLETGGGPPAL